MAVALRSCRIVNWIRVCKIDISAFAVFHAHRHIHTTPPHHIEVHQFSQTQLKEDGFNASSSAIKAEAKLALRGAILR